VWHRWPSGISPTIRSTSVLFPGSVDDVRVYNRIITAAEVKQLYLNESVTIGHSNATVPNGLVGWWTLDGNNLIQNARDSSGQGNNGSLVGLNSTSSAETAGKIGGALKFNGTNQYVNVGTLSYVIGGGSPFSGSAWIKTTASAAGIIVSDWNITVTPG
jgi:hypothetical protein